jgi:hypothetical protein
MSSEMSFKQAKELIERMELTELTLAKTLDNIEKSSNHFQASLKEQEKILHMQPIVDKKLVAMKIVVAVNFGLVIGMLIGKYVL